MCEPIDTQPNLKGWFLAFTSSTTDSTNHFCPQISIDIYSPKSFFRIGVQVQDPYPMVNRTEWKYDVFLSFRGEDTRKSFTDHLSAALIKKGFTVFMDHQNLERGKQISSELLKAIEDSKILIVIFSKKYAASTWCLDEIAKIANCIEKDHIIVPVFYDINPSDVLKQRGYFKKAFVEHEEYFRDNKEKVQGWRNAMIKVANLSGWHLQDRDESKFIQDIVKDISSKLGPLPFINLEDLIGINSRIQKLMTNIKVEFDDVRMIGIYGMGGIGKSTIARIVYDMISYKFEGSSFLANVREISEKYGLVSLQKQLLSKIVMGTDYNIYDVYDGMRAIRSRLRHKKVLVVIDDVDHVEQLNKLVGKHDWFGLGSKIIITTRDKHLLVAHGVDALYKAEELNDDDALQLFNLKAFKRCQPLEDYVELSKYVVKYTGGLPLALQVLGSFLSGRTVDEWKSALGRLKKDFDKNILDVLQISFEGLQEIEKKIFLDIACFFRGENMDYVIKILDDCGLNPIIGIKILMDKSLITVLDENKLWMHDLLQEMDRHIVKRESPKEPGKRSRLCEEGDIFHVLTKNSGTEVVEGIMLNFHRKEVHLCAKAFSKMINLRLLKIGNVQLSEGLEYLPNKLRLLKWHGYPLKSLPSNFQFDEVVEITMHHSRIEQLWNGINLLHQLKSIILSHSKNLKETPDFTRVPNLNELILEGCIELHVIHPSLAFHKKLIILNLKDCTSLVTFAKKIDMKSLRKLVLSGCSKLKRFPEIVGNMECLSELFLDGTAIEELSLSVELLTGLVLLNLKDCNKLESLPSSLNGLKSLKTLNLSGCSKLENLPKNLAQVESLEKLDLSGTAIRQPSSSIFFMENLKSLSFRGCKGPLSKSWYLSFPFRLMPISFSQPMALMLPSLSGLCSLTKLDLSDCNLGESAIPIDFGSLISLEQLNLGKNNFVSLPASITLLSKLQCLILEGCKKLQSLPELPSNIGTIIVDACASLETLSDALKFGNSDWCLISCVNCLKLLGRNNIVLSMLKQYLKGVSNQIEFSIIFPGSEIMEFFSNRTKGSSIRVDRPPDLFDNSKLMGYVVCSVFVVHKHQPTLSDAFGTHKLFCYLKADEELSSTAHFTHFEEKFGQAMPEHQWLLYLSRHEYFDKEWQKEYKHIEFLFSSQWAPGLEVKSCGVYPVYDQLEEFSLTRNQNISSTFGNLKKFPQYSIGLTMDATTKRSQADYDGAESSGIVYSDEDRQTKRFKRI